MTDPLVIEFTPEELKDFYLEASLNTLDSLLEAWDQTGIISCHMSQTQ